MPSSTSRRKVVSTEGIWPRICATIAAGSGTVSRPYRRSRGRAICLDIPRLKGIDRLPDRYEITIDDLKQELGRIGCTVRSGDIVLVRTGKIQDFDNEAAFQAAEPGVGRKAALWLYEAGMAVLGTDTTGTEPLPFDDPAVTTHAAMLVESGVHLIENLYLEEVAREGISEGLFIALPLKITGATGSWLRPILLV